MHISLEGASYDPVPAWAGWDPSFIETYKQYYHHANPYPEVLRAIPAGKIVRASQVVSRRWLDKQPFFHDWLKPAGNYTHGAGVTLVQSGGSVTRLSYDIPRGLAHIEGPTADMLRRLGPHFRRALEIASTGRSNCERDGFRRADRAHRRLRHRHRPQSPRAACQPRSAGAAA